MLILLFIIFLIALIGSSVLACVDKIDDISSKMIGMPSLIGIIIVVISLLVNVFTIVNSRTLDARIQMYEEENIKIETSISETVNNYLSHEKETYTSITPESAAFLATVFPELQSSELAQQQIQVYIKNNDKIKKLKEEKISVSNARWWVYFGR